MLNPNLTVRSRQTGDEALLAVGGVGPEQLTRRFWNGDLVWVSLSPGTVTDASDFEQLQARQAYCDWFCTRLEAVLEATAAGPVFTRGLKSSFQHADQDDEWWPTGYRQRLVVAVPEHQPTTAQVEPQPGIGQPQLVIGTGDEKPPPAEAKRLRALTGLDLDTLGGIFGVSRTAYNNWLRGARPRTERLQHLLQVLVLVEEAARRHSGSSALPNWLLTPLPGLNRRPIDYLKAQNYDAFRGALLRRPTDRRLARPALEHPGLRRRPPRPGLQEALRRLGGRAWIEEDDDGDGPPFPHAPSSDQARQQGSG